MTTNMHPDQQRNGFGTQSELVLLVCRFENLRLVHMSDPANINKLDIYSIEVILRKRGSVCNVC